MLRIGADEIFCTFQCIFRLCRRMASGRLNVASHFEHLKRTPEHFHVWRLKYLRTLNFWLQLGHSNFWAFFGCGTVGAFLTGGFTDMIGSADNAFDVETDAPTEITQFPKLKLLLIVGICFHEKKLFDKNIFTVN